MPTTAPTTSVEVLSQSVDALASPLCMPVPATSLPAEPVGNITGICSPNDVTHIPASLQQGLCHTVPYASAAHLHASHLHSTGLHALLSNFHASTIHADPSAAIHVAAMTSSSQFCSGVPGLQSMQVGAFCALQTGVNPEGNDSDVGRLAKRHRPR